MKLEDRWRQPFRVGHCLVIPEHNRVELNGDHKNLRQKEMDLFVLLARNEGAVVEYEEIDRVLWPDEIGKDHTVNRQSLVFDLRRQLKGLNHAHVVRNVTKKGYWLDAVAELVPAAGPAPPNVGTEDKNGSTKASTDSSTTPSEPGPDWSRKRIVAVAIVVVSFAIVVSGVILAVNQGPGPSIISPVGPQHRDTKILHAWKAIPTARYYEVEFLNAPPHQKDVDGDYVRKINGTTAEFDHQSRHCPLFWRVRAVKFFFVKTKWSIGCYTVDCRQPTEPCP